MDIWTAASGIGGILIGVLAQSIASRLASTFDHRRNLLIEAYSNFIEASAAIAAEARIGEARRSDVWQRILAAKQRILFFAPVPVVHALAEFDRTSQHLGKPDADSAYCSVLRAMRESVGLPPVLDEDMSRVLLGKDAIR